MMRLWRCCMTLLALACASSVAAAPPDVIISAEYSEPTDRYPHGVLGDDIEWGALVLTLDTCAECHSADRRRITIRLPQHRVFEDVAPRLIDLDGTGKPFVVVVESDASQGARLAVYAQNGVVAATPFIGTRNRWLAPIGAADLDGDGAMDLAYIDRPHLAKTLRVWRWDNGTLTQVANEGGLTNHRIGERDIAGGIRDCGQGPEMVVATADWRRVVAVTLREGQLQTRDIGPHQDRASFAAALAC